MIYKAADHKLAFEILWIEPAKLEQNIAKFLVGFGKGLDFRFEPILEHVGDRLEHNLFVGRHARPPFALKIQYMTLLLAI
jgi:hypothetical protein